MPVDGLPNQADDMVGGPDNDERAEWVEQALITFASQTGQDISVEPYDVVGDFLADLGHWCDRNNVDLQDALKTAALHYDAETQSEGKQLVYL